MICSAVFTALAFCVVGNVLHVDAAHVIDVKERFHYALHRQWRLAFRHPTLHALLGLPEDVTLQPSSTSLTVHGVTRRRLRELYKGLEVIDSTVEADVTASGRYDGGQVTGTIFLSLKQDIPDFTKCTLTEEEARQKVFTEENFPADTQVKSEEYLKKVHVDSSKKAHLAYAVTIEAKVPNGKEFKPYYIIDICDGTILQKSKKVYTESTTADWETLPWYTGTTDNWYSPSPGTAPTSPFTGTTTQQTTTTRITTQGTTQAPGECSTYVKGTGGNPKIGEIKYSEAPYKYCLDVTVSGDTCTLDNKYVKVIDLQNTKDLSKEDPVQFKCADGIPNPVTNGAYNPLLDAHHFGTAAFKVFEDWYGIFPLKNKPKMMVHYGNDYANAFWNGAVMAFGDGDSSLYPLVSLDVVAHELSHGVTGQNSDLVYSGQSGGINEAFSDIAGEAAEYYATGENDWKIGFSIFKDPNQAMRYMDDPTKDGISIGHATKFEDDMDVHHSSGVYNKVFHRTVDQGKIPIRYSFESFLIANQKYWTANTNFEKGACGTVRGAYDAGLDTEKFVDAFRSVGLTPCKLTSFLEMLTVSKQRTGVIVSENRRPLFGIKTRSDTGKIKVTAVSASGADVQLDLLRTISRDNAAKTGTGSVEMPASPSVLYYVRAYTGSENEVNDVTLTLTLETTA